MTDETLDIVARYGISKNWQLLKRTVLVEGTSDVTLFGLAARRYFQRHQKELLADMAIIAAGEGERGGTNGVIRELVTLRSLAAIHLSPSGLPLYRVIGLFDSDTAGNNAVRGARGIDASIIEYRDVFRLRPAMPKDGNLDPEALQRSFERLNMPFKGLTWELEDLVGVDFMKQFLSKYPSALIRQDLISGSIHRELTRDGKRELVRFCNDNALLKDLAGIVEVLHALRHYLRLPSLTSE